ncbi:GntR family transcriptional regulator, histidine utilization repressor [Polaromonas sp. OV174]|uniref:histidine utilization repressor n=1 Tax=Polaromonas sp. OV174 TaxID=1855300 RepID=UPI0008F1F798|nr:histidine utilization repressor [Polaromonas sp. OV174]SFB68927.1 GntR family transcriptional regulator, histidine utilization repressor [Polaromonas sp. OV174]
MTSALLQRKAQAARTASGAPAPTLALYEQVKEFITRKIQDGSWPAGHRLPSEHELVAQFGISRMTANRALRELMELGRIVRQAGVGSFVAEDKPQSTLLQIANIESDIRARGHDYSYQLLTAERIAASSDVAAWLDLRAGESVFHSVCLHLEDGTPVQLEDRYVNPRVVPAFLDQDLTVTPPSAYLVRHVPFDQIEHLVDAVLPTAEQAQRLAMPGAEPCLLLTRRTWTRNVPVTLVRCLHPATRYRLGSRFQTDGNPISS